MVAFLLPFNQNNLKIYRGSTMSKKRNRNLVNKQAGGICKKIYESKVNQRLEPYIKYIIRFFSVVVLVLGILFLYYINKVYPSKTDEEKFVFYLMGVICIFLPVLFFVLADKFTLRSRQYSVSMNMDEVFIYFFGKKNMPQMQHKTAEYKKDKT